MGITQQEVTNRPKQPQEEWPLPGSPRRTASPTSRRSRTTLRLALQSMSPPPRPSRCASIVVGLLAHQLHLRWCLTRYKAARRAGPLVKPRMAREAAHNAAHTQACREVFGHKSDTVYLLHDHHLGIVVMPHYPPRSPVLSPNNTRGGVGPPSDGTKHHPYRLFSPYVHRWD